MPESAVLIEHDLEGLPMLDVAESREIPLSTCYKWRARALGALRAEIERREGSGRQGPAGMPRPTRPNEQSFEARITSVEVKVENLRTRFVSGHADSRKLDANWSLEMGDP